ncbi:MAG: recombinase family protein [Actinomycetota bacterium]|nr:recombinase family protein [Actinomycetota bacterium]
MPRRPQAAIYARISQDRDATASGVDRQVLECRAKALELGWEVVSTYIDNDASAYSKRPRPLYRTMLDDLEAGTVNAVLAWHPDRLYRRLQDLAEFVDLCREKNIQVATVQTGRVDLNTPSGRMVAGMLGVAARYESEHKAERIVAANEQRARAGLYHGGKRPFGYESDGITLRPDEAAIIGDLAERFLAGEGLISLVRWLNESGTPSVAGGRWHPSAVRQMLASPRLAGQAVRHGEVIGPAQWPAIITPDQSVAIRAIVNDPNRRHQRTARRYLLAGLLRCSRCGSTLVGDRKKDGPRYTCKRSPQRPDACQGISIKSEPVEHLISEAVLQRLSGGLRPKPSGSVASSAKEELAALETLNMLAEMLGSGSLSRVQYERAAAKANERLARVRANTTSSRVENLSLWKGKETELRRVWPTLTLTRQSAIVHTILDHCVVLPANSGARSVDPSRVEAVWLF